MKPSSDDTVSVAEAAKMLGFSSDTTVRRAIQAGVLEAYAGWSGIRINASDLYTAPLAMIGRLATLAGCSPRTARRRVKAGILVPRYWPTSVKARYSLADVDRLKRSLRRGELAARAALRSWNRARGAHALGLRVGSPSPI